ncbi:hypothetical protein AB0N92_16730 [Streptomyces sp. NPDC093248]|uniref:hypothetical protein n=1 Tax=Streptomyces sp. NPDC093248 TaxID=3155072 RepID=UPI00341EF740
MRVSPAVRMLRGAVFAVLCVLLAAGAHVLATGQAPLVWLQVGACVPVFAAGCLLGGRERSLAGIGGVTLATQGGLHLMFHAAQSHHTAMAMHAKHGMEMSHAHALTPHATAVHFGAAALLTWSLLRWAIAFVPGLAAWWQVARGACGVPGAAGLVRRAVDESWSLRRMRLRYAVHRRGPPTGMSYAI